TLKQLVRTALVAKDCCTFYVSDFSAIEARVIAWFAGEQWRLDVFSTHGKIYEASASQMFGIPIEEIDKELRQKGKISELALGYQGGPGALKQMGALNMGVKEEELQGLVDDWRRTNKKIVQFWKDVQRAAIKAIKSRAPIKLGKLRFRY
ncbi:DNA polymerase, partial [Streptococcus agalactiae]